MRGRDIRKGTVRGTDVRDDDLKGRDVRDDTITGDDVKESGLATVPSARDAKMLAGRPAGAYLGTDAHTLGGKPASAFLASGAQVRSGLVKLAHGETKTLTSSGPFTWKAACEKVGGTDSRLIVTVESTEANSFAADEAAGEPLSPGSRSRFSTGLPRFRRTRSGSGSVQWRPAVPRRRAWASSASTW